MIVRVIDRAAMDQRDGLSYGALIFRTVEISDTCPKCGGPRGIPYLAQYCEDGDWYQVHNWNNPCGHPDKYRDVIKEAESK